MEMALKLPQVKDHSEIVSKVMANQRISFWDTTKVRLRERYWWLIIQILK